jgi:hypothetical protein
MTNRLTRRQPKAARAVFPRVSAPCGIGEPGVEIQRVKLALPAAMQIMRTRPPLAASRLGRLSWSLSIAGAAAALRLA